MDSPFIYNKPVTGKHLIGRRNEVSILGNFITAGENVVISEPPKSGKTSLIRQALFNLQLDGVKFCTAELNLTGMRSAAGIALAIGDAVIKAFAADPAEYRRITADYLGGTHFVFDAGSFASDGKVLSLNWDPDGNDLRAVLELPYHLSFDRKCKTVVLLDEFQDILLCDDGDEFCLCLEDIFKRMPHERKPLCSFIFCGSMVNAMKEIFEKRRLFYRLVERVRLEQIDSKDIVDHAVKGLLVGGKVLDRELMSGVCDRFRGNMWYINHFCAICDYLSRGYVMEPILRESFDTLLAVHEPRFRAMVADLTTFQLSLLRAISDGNTKFSSADIIERYSLNSSANVRRLKDALCKKEIVTFRGSSFEEGTPEILDPLFAWWVGNVCFK